MIPDLPTLERIAGTPSGDLAQTPFPVLLVANARHRSSILLEVKSGPVTKSITIVDGVPVDCRSNLLHDTLGRFLMSRRLLTLEQLEHCSQERATSDRSLEQVLLDRGILDEVALSRVLQQSLARKLLDAFAWRKGAYRSVLLTTVPSTQLKVKVAQLVVMGIEKFASEEQIAAAFAPLVGRPLYLCSTPALPLSELRLTEQQQRLIDGLRAGHRADELAAGVSDAAQLMRALYALAVLGHIATDEPTSVAPDVVAPIDITRPDRVSAAPPVAVSPPVVHEPAAVVATVSTIDPEQLNELHGRLTTLTGAQLLEVAPDATAEHLDVAFVRFAERFAPWTMTADSDLATKARDVFLAGGRAYGELATKRRAATEPVKAPVAAASRSLTDVFNSAPTPTGARDAFRIETELLDPDQQFRRGIKLIEKKRYPEALEQLQYAVDCDPQNSTYRAELARCHYLSSPSVRASSAIKDLEEAVRVDPECGIAFYYLGDILAAVGRVDEAQGRLKRAARLMLPDRRALERLNELRTPQQKKGLSMWPRSKN